MLSFTWELGYFCNFRCFYCFYTRAGWDTLGKKQKIFAPEEITDAWRFMRRKYGRCRIMVTGGEPFLYPDFTGIIKNISEYHVVHITTNLSVDLKDFIEKVEPLNVEFNCTYHPMYISLETFTGRVMQLKKAGYKFGVCYLAHPLQLREMLNYKKFFSERGITFAVTAFRGNYEDRDYPEMYTAAQKNYIEHVIKLAPDTIDETRITPVDRSGEQIEDIRSTSSQYPKRVCGAGYSYAMISNRGDTYRCGQVREPGLGNLYENSIKLFDAPKTCPAKYCLSGEKRYEKEY